MLALFILGIESFASQLLWSFRQEVTRPHTRGEELSDESEENK